MNKNRGIVLTALFFLLIGSSCERTDRPEDSGDDSVVPTPVKVYSARRETVSEKIFNTGQIQAWKKITIVPDIQGKIAKIYVQEGDRVKSGQLLAELDTRAFRLQLEQAEASLAVSEANHRDAKRNLDRMERLNEENAVSTQQVEKVRFLFEAAEAQLQQSRALLKLAQHNIDVSLMRAPFEGIVASIEAEEGEVINPLMGGFFPNKGILTLVDYSKIRIEVDVSQLDAARIKVGQPASVEVSAFPGRAFSGLVSIVNETADELSKKFRVVVEVDNVDLSLKPNTFGDVTCIVDEHTNVLVVPPKAILQGSFAFVVQDDSARKVDVILGFQNKAYVEVTSGLEEGDLVIVEGNFGLKEGAPIDVREILK